MRNVIEIKEENYHLRPNYDFIVRRAVEEEAFLIVASPKSRLSIFQHINRANNKSKKSPLKIFSRKLKDGRFLMRISEDDVHHLLNEYKSEHLKKRYSFEDYFKQLDQQGYLIVRSLAKAYLIMSKYKKARNLAPAKKGDPDKGYECSELKDGRVVIELKKSK